MMLLDRQSSFVMLGGQPYPIKKRKRRWILFVGKMTPELSFEPSFFTFVVVTNVVVVFFPTKTWAPTTTVDKRA